MSSTPSPGNDRVTEPLFREEAMHEYARGRLEGKLLRISPAWADWVFWVLMATLATAAAFVFLVQIDHIVSGPAIIRRPPASGAAGDLEVVALLPGNTRAQLHAHQRMSVHWDGASLPSLDLDIDDVAPEIVGPERARTLLGSELSGILDLKGPVVFVRARLPSSAATPSSALVPGTSGAAEVRVGRHRLIEELLPGKQR